MHVVHSHLRLCCHNRHRKGWPYVFSTRWSGSEGNLHELMYYRTAGLGRGMVLGRFTFRQTWIKMTVDSSICSSRSGLESAQGLLGLIGLGPRLWLKNQAVPPRGSQGPDFWRVFQVAAHLAPWFLLPVSALTLKNVNKCPNWELVEVWKSY